MVEQVGGSHYNAEYQHWDFSNDLRLPYLVGCATKYITRWRKKNGVEDLQKALSYIDKCIEVKPALLPVQDVHGTFWRFAVSNRLHVIDGAAIFWLIEGDWQEARQAVAALLEQAQQPS